MPAYCLSYDLRAPGRNYQPLYDALRAVNAVRALQSLWFFDDPRPSAQVRDAVRQLVDQNDGVLVMQIASTNWASFELQPAAAEWLKARFP